MSSEKFDKFARSVPAEKFDGELDAISKKFLLIYESKKFQPDTNLYDKFVLRFGWENLYYIKKNITINLKWYSLIASKW